MYAFNICEAYALLYKVPYPVGFTFQRMSFIVHGLEYAHLRLDSLCQELLQLSILTAIPISSSQMLLVSKIRIISDANITRFTCLGGL